MKNAQDTNKLNRYFIGGLVLALALGIVLATPSLVNRLAFAFIHPRAKGNIIEITPEVLNALIKVESSNNPRAYNRRTKARGLTQITPIAWKDLRRHFGYKYNKINYYKDIYTPEIAKEAGKDYLYILQKYLKINGIPITWENLLAAYVWGHRNLIRYGLHGAPRGVKRYVARVKHLAQITD